MTVKFALIGTGMVSHVHAEAIRSLPNAELTSVYARHAENGEAFARRYGCKVYTDMDKLLDGDADAVSTI